MRACILSWSKKKIMCFFKSRFVVFGVPGRAPGGVRESRTGHFTKSAQKCLGAFRGPTLARKTRDNFARSRSRCGSGAIFRNYRAFYALKWVPDLPRDTFGEIDDVAISALPAPSRELKNRAPGMPESSKYGISLKVSHGGSGKEKTREKAQGHLILTLI